MTIREKLDETQLTIQTYYQFGELAFSNLRYHLNIIRNIMVAYGKQFPDLEYHVEKRFLEQLDAAFGNIDYLEKRPGFNTSFDVQNNFLNDVKANSARAYWAFVQFVNGKQDGFLDQVFNG